MFTTSCVSGRCVPYNPGETNAACTRPTVPAFLAPGILCSYEDRSPTTDPFHGYTSVSPSLVVVDFRFDPTATSVELVLGNSRWRTGRTGEISTKGWELH